MKFKFIILLLAIQALKICAQETGQKMTPKEINLLVDSIDRALNRSYVYPEKAVLMTRALKSNVKKGAYASAKNRMELSMQISNDIQKAHKDGHLRVYYDPLFAKNLETQVSDSLQKQEEERLVKNARENNFRFVRAEILPGNIGYLRWDGFEGCTKEAKPTINSAFLFVSNTRALIIDMRYNMGGSPETVLATQDYFFDHRVPMNHIIGRDLDTAKRFTDPAHTTFKLTMPVYVLTSRSTFSGAEDFTYGLKYAQRATIVGDTTGGGAHPTGPYSVGQGFVITIPGYRSYHEVTKTDWEGVGVRPTIPVASEKALAKAQALILADAISKAKDPGQKGMLQLSFNAARLKLMPKDSVRLGKDVLQSYCGEYMADGNDPRINAVSVLLNGESLYRHLNNGVPDARLIPISQTKFAYDDDSGRTLELIMDKDGKPSGIVILGQDGRETARKRKN